MKKQVLSLSLLLAFVAFFALGDFTPFAFVENASTTVEYVVEDRIAEKDVKISSDDNSLSMADLLCFNALQKTIISTFKHNIYTYEYKNTPFKPPIFS